MIAPQINSWRNLPFIAWPIVFALMIWNCQGNEPLSVTNTVTAASILKNLEYKPVSAHLLAFISREDRRPWYVDDALLVLQLPKGEWLLVHTARNPRYPKGHQGGASTWHVYQVMDAAFVGDRHFDHRPTRAELDKFLKDNDWQFESDKSWRVVGRAVDEETWQKVLGYKSPLVYEPSLSRRHQRHLCRRPSLLPRQAHQAYSLILKSTVTPLPFAPAPNKFPPRLMNKSINRLLCAASI